MLTIHKQTLEIVDEQFIEVPEGSELLTVQLQNGAPQIWYKCDTEATKVFKRIRIYGTGNPMNHCRRRDIFSDFSGLWWVAGVSCVL